ncbi:MAG: PSD1 domain-containing protein [Planctomycetes bacterium]|nr:PSD1 domain-containing protein [Planctomycetota bacterium]
MRTRIIASLLFTATCITLPRIQAAPPAGSEKPPTREESEYFEKKIRPILVKNCYECHSGDVQKAKGHFVLDTREGLRAGGDSGPVIVPGQPDDSPLIEAIKYEGLEMPPKEKLSDELIQELTRWVEMGAPDPRVGKAAQVKNKIDLAEARKFWAFQPPHRSPPPASQATVWARTDLDRYIQSARDKKGLAVAPDADRQTLLRRITFDLTGLPPTPEEVDQFVNDTSDNALATVVDRLLASPRFGEKWGRHWLDVVRFGESTGKERNIPFRYAWRYRNYVIDALNADLPFDQFIVEQLAGDLLPADTDAERDRHLIATGFLAVGTKGVNIKDGDQFRYEVIDDQIDVTSRAFLGLTVACARCHDHKFDPIPISDYYALAGIFRSTDTHSGVKPGAKSATDRALLKLVQTGSTTTATSRKTTKELAGHAERQKEIEEINAKLTALRQQQRDMRKVARQQNNKKKKKPQVPAQPVADNGSANDLRKQVKELEDRLEKLEGAATPAGDFVMGVSDGKIQNSPLLNRGELKDKGEEVPRGVLTVLHNSFGKITPKQSGRLELAHWIASPDNPLTARVFVNRVWQHLFGEGLVASIDNFGALGEEPTHPELLDALALQFMNEGWSVKNVIRTIVLSRTYQMSSQHSAADFAIDPENHYYWRKERRRLEAEEIRDAVLAVAGALETDRPEGSPVLDLPNNQIKGGKGLGDLRKATNVRSVYLPIVRGNVPEMLAVFDAADPSLIIGKRDVTTVPTQALYLLNNSFMMKQAEQLAQRVLKPSGLNLEARIDLSYRLVLGRLPSPHEKSEVFQFLNDYQQSLEAAGTKGNLQLATWASFCQTLLASGEFRYVY